MRAPSSHLRVGCDVLKIEQLAAALNRNGHGFAATLFTPAEMATAADDTEHLSRLFAVKEASMKALGFGLSFGISPLRDFEIVDSSWDCSSNPSSKLLRHSVTWRHADMATSDVAMAAYSWCRDDYVYARAYFDTRTLHS